jgi:hypothetical protein
VEIGEIGHGTLQTSKTRGAGRAGSGILVRSCCAPPLPGLPRSFAFASRHVGQRSAKNRRGRPVFWTQISDVPYPPPGTAPELFKLVPPHRILYLPLLSGIETVPRQRIHTVVRVRDRLDGGARAGRKRDRCKTAKATTRALALIITPAVLAATSRVLLPPRTDDAGAKSREITVG